jgi:ubiquinone biosynthesis protein Coq4
LLTAAFVFFSISLFLPQIPLLAVEEFDEIEIEHFDDIEFGIDAVIGVFALLLFSLSILAYKRTRLKMMVYAAGAFVLFAIQLLLQSLEETYDFLESPLTDIMTSAITLAILVLFFLAIVRGR